MNEARDRCAAFVTDIVEVCKKHRVIMRLDEDEIESPVFEEHPEVNGFGFILETEDLEDAIRNAVWDVVHPSA